MSTAPASSRLGSAIAASATGTGRPSTKRRASTAAGIELHHQVERATSRYAMRAPQGRRRLRTPQGLETGDSEVCCEQVGPQAVDEIGARIHGAIQSCLGLRHGNSQSWRQRTRGLGGHPRLHVVRRPEAGQPRVERRPRRVAAVLSSRPSNSGSPPSTRPTSTRWAAAKRSPARCCGSSPAARMS